MGTFGERLQREREMRGITLEDIAEATKIGTRSLRALEDEQFDKLPGGIFNKGFVRAYARYLGIDEEQAVADYLVAIKETEGPQAELGENATADRPPIDETSSSGGTWRSVALIILIVAVAAGAWHLYNRKKMQTSEASVAMPAPQTPTAPAPPPQTTPPPDLTSAGTGQSSQPTAVTSAPTTKAAPARTPDSPLATDSNADAQTPAGGSGFVLNIRAREDSWMEITADGKIVMSRILSAAEAISVHAQKRVTLKTGNAGGVEVSFNGKTLPPIGDDRQVRTVTFTPDGIQQ